MYVNKCIKCGREFETKNPKRVICPDCLYPDKKMIVSPSSDSDVKPDSGVVSSEQNSADTSENQPLKSYSTEEPPRYYSAGGAPQENRFNRPQRPYNNQGGYNRPQGGFNRDNQGGYNRPQGGFNRDNQGGYNRPQGGFNRDNQGGYNRPQGNFNRDNQGGYNRPQGNFNRDNQGGYNRPQGNFNRDNQGGYNRPQGNFNRPQNGGFQQRSPQGNFGGGFNNRPQGGGFPNRRPMPNRNRAPKQLLVSREQLDQIEVLYKLMLPLPNPNCHETIGEKINLESRKVFFGINLIRQKMMLPKLPFPKRKLAISPDQLFAIKNLYEPLLPLPPIGCHKIIASQLKMDEWRVHVGIGLVRSQMGLERWNQERDDVPEEFKKAKIEEKVEEKAKTKAKEPKIKETKETKTVKKAKTVKAEKAEEVEEADVSDEVVEEVKPKRGRKPKKVAEDTVETVETTETPNA